MVPLHNYLPCDRSILRCTSANYKPCYQPKSSSMVFSLPVGYDTVQHLHRMTGERLRSITSSILRLIHHERTTTHHFGIKRGREAGSGYGNNGKWVPFTVTDGWAVHVDVRSGHKIIAPGVRKRTRKHGHNVTKSSVRGGVHLLQGNFWGCKQTFTLLHCILRVKYSVFGTVRLA